MTRDETFLAHLSEAHEVLFCKRRGRPERFAGNAEAFLLVDAYLSLCACGLLPGKQAAVFSERDEQLPEKGCISVQAGNAGRVSVNARSVGHKLAA